MSWSVLLRIAALALFACTGGLRAQCFDWSAEFGPAAAKGGARAQAVFDDGNGSRLYVAGDAPGPGLNAVHAWSGAAWSQIPSRLGSAPASYARITSMVAFDDGSGPSLVAAGRFVSIDGVAASNIARWNGTSWMPMGAGLNGEVRALAVYDIGSGPELYAGGTFYAVPSSRVARWNGSGWSMVGSTMGNTVGPVSVDTLLVHDDGSGPALIAGGWFDSVDGMLVRNVARWNGSTWSAYGSGAVLSTFALCAYDDGSGPALFAGGINDYTNTGFIAKLDNQGAWTIQGGAIDGTVGSLQAFDDGSGSKLYVGGAIRSIAGSSVGDYGIACWNGTTWSTPTGGNGLLCTDCGGAPIVRSMALYDDGSGTGLYVGGNFEFADVTRVDDIARLGPGGWSALGAGKEPAGRVRVLRELDDGSGPALYAGGVFAGAGAVYSPLVARFDGSNWSAVGGGGAANGEVRALVSYDDGSGPVLVASGTFTLIDGVPASRIARWNGVNWAEFGGGIVAAFGETHVSDLAVFDHGTGPQLYASGWFSSAGGTAVANIARWNGTSWQPLGAGTLGSPTAFAVYDSGSGPALYVGLEFATVSGVPNVFGIARWNGTAWSSVGGGLWNSSGARDLAVYDDGSGPALYAIGNFTKAAQLDVRGLARWNGTTWSGVGGGLTPTATLGNSGSALGVFDEGGSSVLFAAGFADVASTSGEVFHGIARWNGSEWSDVNGGLSGAAPELGGGTANIVPVDTFATFGGKLYIGGGFTQAGTSASAYLARWEPACNCAPVSYCTAGTTTNGCQAQISASGTPSATATSGFTLQVQQVEGAKSGLIFYGTNGRHSAPWGNGTSYLCVRSPTQRTDFHSAGGIAGQCNGTLSIDWNSWIAQRSGTLGASFSVGQAVQAQGWFRDPPAPKSTSLSNAIEFYVCP
ncbi:MAG: hypothetical protein IT454_22860 [Planctomycetes bacterium]|nr:hypothetical protein [Planctomycetota bacterium]